MRAVSSIGTIFRNSLPRIEELQHYFFSYSGKEWATGGASGASFIIYGLNDTDQEEPFRGRIDAHLAVIDHSLEGMYLYYSKTGGGFSEHYFSIGDLAKVSEMVTSRAGDPLSKALFTTRENAWLAVVDFIEGVGVRTDKITWAKPEDLPPEAFPSVLDL